MTIIDEAMLIMVSVTDNNNKFYHVTLDENGTVVKRWGRVGAEGTSSSESTGKNGFDRVIAAKTKKGYQKTEVVSASVETRKVDDLSRIAKTALRSKSATTTSIALDTLIDNLVRMNNHDILESSGGMIKVDTSGLITTPLGLISSRSITEATGILHELQQTNRGTRAFTQELEHYLRLIPQNIGRNRNWQDKFLAEATDYVEQENFLKQLNDSLTLHEDRKKLELATKQDASETDESALYEKLFRLRINVLEDQKKFKEVNNFFEVSKAKYQSGASRFRLKQVFVLEDSVDTAKKVQETVKKLGNVRTLWHGTRANNALSILRKGLIIPPINGSGIQIQGRLFGSGTYASDDAKKSINYSGGGVWDRGPKTNHCYMFLTDIAMGREHIARSGVNYSNDHIQRGGKYDSIFAEGGKAGVMNNEMIVWNPNQINLRYLCEFGV